MTAADRPAVLVITPNTDVHLDWMRERYTVTVAATASLRAETIAARGAEFRYVLTNGTLGLTADEIAALPNVKLVCTQGVGYENVDLAAARAAGVKVTNGAGTNDVSVADHALGLLFAVKRRIPELDAATRAGKWRDAVGIPPAISGKRLGILGMGTIGACIARRAAAFDMPTGYHNRRPKADTDAQYFDSVQALAEWADVLIVAVPGGQATHHMVNAAVLKALGPQGYLINIGRGSVVDTQALANALKAGTIAGAGLDVYEGEPQAPTVLLDCPNLVLSPHVAGWSPEAVDATVNRFLDNVGRHVAGQPLVHELV
ncbi:2-hydroxyacid dehydrogenase [Schauerella aestuarii]|uniref:2-hydroxyacid dehydrogenase n=1 Tax=Schauerella aestuarii TaxID=2511204 RepID=UPI001926E65B|nr:2-hydroxyacid dehydrogenase [Achromobacter aestuarii]